MDDDHIPEQASRGLSAGQMVFLFLAGVVVCAIFFTIGFVVGYNEKSSSAAPVTEKLAESPDVPPVVGEGTANASAASGRSGAKDKSLNSPAESSGPIRPQPRTSSEKQNAVAESELEPRMPTAVMPSKATRPAATSTTNTAEPSAAPSGSGMMIQVAATGTKPDAEKMVRALRALSYPAVLLSPAQAHATDNLFRVEVGPYATREAAEKIKERLIQDGFKQPFIKH